MFSLPKIAVIGASTLVGQAIIEGVFKQALTSMNHVIALDASEKAGESIQIANQEVDLESVESAPFDDIDIIVFASEEAVFEPYRERACSGAIILDVSKIAARKGWPLVLAGVKDSVGTSMALPSCSASLLVTALAPLKPFGLERVIVSTYQPVSESDKAGIEELAQQTTSLFSHQEAVVSCYAKRIAFNLLPQIGNVDAQGTSTEEQRLTQEVTQLLDLPSLNILPTCVRVPLFFGYASTLVVDLATACDIEKITNVLQEAGLYVIAPNQHQGYITPMEATGNQTICISRLRAQSPNTLSFWLAADNIQAGVARNVLALLATRIIPLR